MRPLEGVNYHDKTPLLDAVGQNARECVDALIAAGANVHHVGCYGNALAYVNTSGDAALPIAQALLRAGVDVDGRAFDETVIERWIKNAAPTKPGAGTSKREAAGYNKSAHRFLTGIRDLVGTHAATVDKAIAKLDKAMGNAVASAQKTAAGHAALLTPAALKKASWQKDVAKLLASIDDEAARDRVRETCAGVLAQPAAVAHPAWPDLIRHTWKLSATYGDLTESAYGERLSIEQMDDDEGGTMDMYGDEHMHTFDYVLATLAAPAAIAHRAWADLVIELCAFQQAAIGHYSYGDDEVAALLAVPEAQKHPRYAEVVAAAQAAFPFARIAKKTPAAKKPAPKKPAKKPAKKKR